ncbi:hypothetical protein [Vibrio agarivorans]|uniref:hypothetical protein n=1 Tax=Vibrio agarivorans TaxID=153622 RepID=UPI002232A483|nr:hypothetical protein [Vibrio agarivorans]
MDIYQKSYNKHVRLAREAAKGLTTLARAEAIYFYFSDNTDHPHPRWTYEEMMKNRLSDHQFPIDLLRDMADLTARNEMHAVDKAEKNQS